MSGFVCKTAKSDNCKKSEINFTLYRYYEHDFTTKVI